MSSVRRRQLSGHRQVILLGVAALLVLAVVGATGTVLTRRAQEQLDRSTREVSVPLEEIRAFQGHLTAALNGYQEILLRQQRDEGSATMLITRVSQGYGRATASWDRFQQASLGLPGEDELATLIQPVLSVGSVEASAVEAAQVVDAGDAPALAARLAELAAVTTSIGPIEAAVEDLVTLYEGAKRTSEDATAAELDEVVPTTGVVALVTTAPLLAAFVLLARSSRRREYDTAALAEARQGDARRNEFEARLQRAFDMATTEALTYPVVEAALESIVDGASAELLVADSSRAHIHQAARTGPGGPEAGCGVGSPAECPAAQRAQTQVFASSTAIDACPHLRGRPGGSCSAVCVPVSLAGRAAGVVHVVADDGVIASEDVVADLEMLARKAGDRISMLRAFTKSERQARTDPLTGLLNRRSLEVEAGDVAQQGRYVVAYGDLDHFKQLNDLHGHDAGDRALRLFSRVLRDSVRPADLPARYGGEEFVVVFPNCSLGDASAVVDRLRVRLNEALFRGSVPSFTVSFGLAAADEGDSFADVVERADIALLAAKAAGRDRTILSDTPSLVT